MKASGDRPEREPESATFETARVGGRRGAQPVFILGFVAVIGVMITISIAGRPSAPPLTQPGARASLDATAPAASAPTAAPRSTPDPTLPIFRPDDGPVFTSAPGPLVMQATRHRETVFVHGDVFVARVTWVFVSLQDDIGNVAGWASVSVPGAAGPGSSDGPTLRFDVELALRGEFSQRLWVQAQAYDADGVQIAATRVELPVNVGIASDWQR